MTKREDHKFVDEDKLFGEAFRIPSEGAFPSFFIPFTDFGSDETIQIRAKLTMSDGSVVFTDAVTFDTPAIPTTTTTTTTTTTDSPNALIYDITNLSDCACGIVELPAGSAYQSSAGLSMRLIDSDNSFLDVPLLHNQSVSIEQENKFKTITNYITESISPTKLVLYIDTDLFFRLTVENVVIITVKSMKTKKILYNKPFGSLSRKIKIRASDEMDKPSIVLNNISSDDLKDDALIVEVKSHCEYKPKPCCDSLPENIQVFSSGSICLPLNEFYPDDVNPVTTTTAQPDSITFENLAASSTNNIVQLSADISTFFNSDIIYFVELKEADYHVRLSGPLSSKSGDTITFSDQSYGTALKYRFAVTNPLLSYSDYITVANSLVTTTFHPDPELTTSYTTPPPPATPSITNVSLTDGFGGQDWVLTWNANNDLDEMSDLRLQWRYKNNALSNHYNNTPWNEVPVSTSSNPTGLTKTISGIDSCEIIEWRLGVVDGHQLTWSANYEFMNGSLPSPVKYLSYDFGSSSTNLSVTWTEPDSLGSCVRQDVEYLIELINQDDYTGDSTSWLDFGKFTNPSSTVVSTTLVGLNSSNAYLVRVKPRTTLGDGAWTTVGPSTKLLINFESYIGSTHAGWQYRDISAYGNHLGISPYGTDFEATNCQQGDPNGDPIYIRLVDDFRQQSSAEKKFGTYSYSTVLAGGSGSPAYEDFNVAFNLTCADFGGPDGNVPAFSSNDDATGPYFHREFTRTDHLGREQPDGALNLVTGEHSKGTIEFFFKLDGTNYTGTSISPKLLEMLFMHRYHYYDSHLPTPSLSNPVYAFYDYEGSDSFGVIHDAFNISFEIDFATGQDPKLYLVYSQDFTLEKMVSPTSNGQSSSAINDGGVTVPGWRRRYQMNADRSDRNILDASLDNDWHHYVLQIDSSKNNPTDNEFIKVYIDGQKVFSGSTPVTVVETQVADTEGGSFGWNNTNVTIETNGYHEHEWHLNHISANYDYESQMSEENTIGNVAGYYDSIRFVTGLVYCGDTFTPITQSLVVNPDTGCS